MYAILLRALVLFRRYLSATNIYNTKYQYIFGIIYLFCLISKINCKIMLFP